MQESVEPHQRVTISGISISAMCTNIRLKMIFNTQPATKSGGVVGTPHPPTLQQQDYLSSYMIYNYK